MALTNAEMPARVITAQCRRGPVLGAHQGQMQQISTCHPGADFQTGTGVFVSIDIFFCNFQYFIHVLHGFHDDQTRHQFRDGCHRQCNIRVFFEQNLEI